MSCGIALTFQQMIFHFRHGRLIMPTKRALDQLFIQPVIGPLERQAMQILWSAGELSVREVMLRLPQRRAYTTVMTTLDRLFKKDAVRRKMRDRAYIYSPSLTREQWRETIAREVVARLQVGPENAPELLACLLKTLLEQQPQLLSEINPQIRPADSRDPSRKCT
jgi:predicted transcriptional regulator